jgi:hypothetical protein
MKKAVLILVILSLTFAAAFSEGLAPSASVPKLDGIVGPKEYSQFSSIGGIRFGASLSNDGILTLAIQADTSGWVAIGLGSAYMDGSYMVMAYEAAGKSAVSEQIGAGHSHSPAKGTKVLKSVVHSVNGTTTLEFQVKASDFVKGAQLPVILAYGRTPDFISRHLRFAQTILTFTN